VRTNGETPSQDELLELHRAHRAGDPTAPARLADAVLDPLVRRVRGQIRQTYSRDRVDDPQIESACGLTVANYLQDPDRYEPSKGSLLSWLAMDAIGDIRNEATSASARRESPDSEVVELRTGSRKSFLDEVDSTSAEEGALDRLDRFDLPPEVVSSVREAVGEYEPEDFAMIELMGQGVRETAAYAEVLGISHLPAQVQRAEVKKHKDRLSRRLERLRDRLA